MRTAFQLAALLVLPTLAWADGPSDLRASLDNLHGHALVKVSMAYSNRTEATSLLRPVTSQGSLQVKLIEDGSGLHEDWDLAEMEAANREKRETSLSPIQDAMKELDARRLDQLLNQAEVLTRFLDASSFKSEDAGLYEGKPARVLIFTFSPAIRPDLQGRLTHSEATFKVWIGEDGRPMASESFTDHEGRHTRPYGRFHNRSLVKTTYAIFGRRLVVASRISDDLAYDTGEKTVTRKTLNLAPMD
jgi:hypothetical protein